MAAHGVDVTLPTRELGRADVRFEVKVDGVAHGALHVSRGSVVWFSANKMYGHKINWTKFAKLMEENGVRSEKRQR